MADLAHPTHRPAFAAHQRCFVRRLLGLAAALLVGGFGLLFMPASLALADPRRSPETEPQDITVTKGRRR